MKGDLVCKLNKELALVREQLRQCREQLEGSEDPDNPNLTVEDIKDIMSYDPEAEVARLEEKLDAVERDRDTLKSKLAEAIRRTPVCLGSEGEVVKHATVNIGEFKNIPLIGIPASATEMECECCHNIFHISTVSINEEGSKFLCEKCKTTPLSTRKEQ